MGQLFEMLGAAFFLVLGLMSLLWIVFYFKAKASIVDVGWALGFILSSWAYFFIGYGAIYKKLTLLTMVTVWGLRLALHLSERYQNSNEDPRYQAIRLAWGNDHTELKFFLLFIFQGLLVVLLTLPFLIVNGWAVSDWSGFEVFGILLWMAGLMGETLADKQLRDFKKDPLNEGKVCKIGLWQYSRHPNYFFEFVVWVAFFCFALGTSGGLLAILSPALIYYLLHHVSGIPMNEAEARKSKGAEYDEYVKTTSAFFPWFHKSGAQEKDL